MLVDTQSAAIDGYTETGAGSASLTLPARHSRNSAIEMGAGLVVPMPLGTSVLTARLNAGYRHLFEDGSGVFDASFVGTPVSFSTRVTSPGRSQAHVGASMTASLSQNLSAGISYRGVASNRMTSHVLEAKIALTM